MSQKQPRSSEPVPAFSDRVPELGLWAARRFPGGVHISPDNGVAAAAAQTHGLLQQGAGLLYGAVFLLEGMFVVIDVLIRQDGHWKALVVRPSTRLKEWHLTDAATHEFILQRSGVQPVEIGLLLLNMQYVRRGDLDPKELFIEERPGRRLLKHRPLVRGRMQMLKRMAAKKIAQAARAEEAGAMPASEAVAMPVGTDPEVEVDAAPLRDFLDRLQFPLYFMDFEAYQTAIPEYEGHWPFRQLPFQFSLHCLETPDGPLRHVAFIAPPDEEPTGAFGAALLPAVGSEGTVLVYNLDSEQLLLHQLAQDYPQWRRDIEALQSRLVDLMVPLVQQFIRIPALGNKRSLKYVLPYLAPEMSYASLHIGNGDEANRSYNAMRASSDPGFRAAQHEALLAYCAVDTLAMVRILERMRVLAG